MALALREEAGFDQKQAEGTARALSRLLVADLVTKTDLSQEAGSIRAEIKVEVGAAKVEIIKWLFGTMVAQTGLILAAFKLLRLTSPADVTSA